MDAGGLDPEAIPGVYSGICYHNSASYDPHRAEYVFNFFNGLYLKCHILEFVPHLLIFQFFNRIKRYNIIFSS